MLDSNLQLNNGGKTPTHTLGAGSSALNAGSNPANLTLDQNGNPRIQNGGVDIGSVERIIGTPTATVGTLVSVNANTTGSINPYQFTVTYTDAFAIVASSIVSGNIIVSRNGASFTTTPTLVNMNPAGQNAQSIVATYQFTPPGGIWDAADNGTYSVILASNQVRNIDSVFVPSSTLGTITVNFATTYAVLNTSDSGAGSLRQAILDANANANAADTIIFEATTFSTPKTITLTGGELSVSESLTINGPGRNLLTISGNNLSRIFNFDGTGVQTIAISDMTLTKGNATGSGGSGGAILDQDENLTLTRMTLTGNHATLNGGALQLTQGQNTTVAIVDSTINANAASATIISDGGGIAILSPAVGADAYLVLQGSTVSNNSAADDGGGISLASNTSLLFESSLLFGNVCGFAALSSDGGGLAFNGSVGSNGFVIRNSTISNNTTKAIAAALPSLSGGGLGLSEVSGTVNILNSTIVANSSGGKSSGAGQGGGGIAITGANSHLDLQSSIVALNLSAIGRPDLASETPVDYSHSAIGSKTGFSVGVDGGGNVAFGTDLKLALLTGNGGTSRTVAIRPGSPLINTGTYGVLPTIQLPTLTTDQRGSGFARQVGNSLDIGAFEYIPGIPIAIPSAVSLPSIVTNTAQTNPFRFTINYTADTPLNLTTIGNNDILVTGPNGFNTVATFVSLDTGTDNTNRTATYSFVPPGGSWDSIDNGEFIFTILPGSISTIGGDFVFSSQSSSMFCIMPANFLVTTTADSGVGSLRDAIGSANGNAGGTVDIITFAPSFYSSPQTITLTGGEIPITDGINIQGPGANLLTVSGNNASRLFNIDNSDLSQITATISGLTLSSGSTAGDGGAIQFADECLNLIEDHVTASTAGGKGGGVAASSAGAVLNVTRSTIANNKAGSDGGGAYMTGAILGGTANILNSTLAKNTAVSVGGGFAGAFGGGVGIGLTLDQSTLTANSSGGAGGGFRLGDNTSAFANLSSTIVSGNAGGGGGVDIALANVTSTYSAIGNGAGFTVGSKTSDLAYGASLNLGTLGNNGGPMPTVSLTAGSAAIDKGTLSTGQVTDQRLAGFARSVNTSLDIGAYEVQPTVTGLIVNGGATQRSRILSIEVFFNVNVTAAVFGLLGAVKLTRTAVAYIPAGSIGDFIQSGETAFSTGIINVAQGATNSLLLTFDNTTAVPETATVENTSLSDGYWKLSIGQYSTATGLLNLRRLYGDMTSSVGGTVDGADLAILGNNFNTNFIALDFNNDGTTDGADLAVFGNRFVNTL